MLQIALFEPEIPPNTGNIMRLCVNTGSPLHLIAPLGFELSDRQLRRAGLDYREFAEVTVHESLPAMLEALSSQGPSQGSPPRVWTISTRASQSYTQARFSIGDVLLFGPETRGLPQQVLDAFGDPQCLRIPMRPNSRSINLSNAAALVLYEGLRQLSFPEMA
ncbi:MAG: tRNA (cytidine/uridine-2'-O-)-methyltransferase [Halieaceae bacterium]|jgi:tRNA (cytidine/uridine-2'-O-)-methyltransferase